MKVRYENFNGERIDTNVADYICREISTAGGHGYGQIEQLQAELDTTRDILARLVTVLEDDLTTDQIRYLCTGSKEPVTWPKFEILEETER